MRRKQEAIVLYADTFDELNEKLDNMLDDGWVTQGGVTVSADEFGGSVSLLVVRGWRE